MDITVGTTSTIPIEDTAVMSEEDALQVYVRTLLLAREGTIPGSRNFGLPQNHLAAPDADIALNIIAMELQEKLDEYVEDVDVKSVTGEFDSDGHLKATVTVERS